MRRVRADVVCALPYTEGKEVVSSATPIAPIER
jgi:hypothetical protein